MGLDDLKGRAKEAAGRLTGDRRLQREGRIDRMTGRVKDAVDKVKGRLTGKGGR
ncbi:MAG: CsbD family protein [Egibacteraceae bacterium]